jgi:hypothetical protein
MINETLLKEKFSAIWPHLNERSRRMMAAVEAKQLGRGGVTLVSRACGLSRVTITKGIRELDDPSIPVDRIRRQGGGRPSLVSLDPALPGLLESLIDPLTMGDPESPLRWTCKSTRALARDLTKSEHPISHEKVAQLLKEMDYSLQGNRKADEGDDHPDRDAQFRYINRKVRQALARCNPVISVDTKKKELLGNFDNKGRRWRKAKTPLRVNGHDFPDPSIPRAYPYGIFDLGLNRGFVNVGTDHDTASFAVASVKGWWHHEGKQLYPKATRVLITADSGGSNGYRLRLWKFELQKMANEIQLPISVCHFPPGTSKWNKVEHRLFSFISSNWRGEPLRDYETIVRLIAATTTAKGLSVICRLDRGKYPVGRKVSDQEMAKVLLSADKFHGEWNYSIRPQKEDIFV